MQTGKKERDERDFRHRKELERRESVCLVAAGSESRGNGVAGSGWPMPATNGGHGAAPRRARSARQTGRGRTKRRFQKRETKEGGRAYVALVACRPFPFRRPVNGSPRRCPRKPHESLSASQAMPAVTAAHRHGHCCYRLRRSLPLLAVSVPSVAVSAVTVTAACPPSPPPRQKKIEKKRE